MVIPIRSVLGTGHNVVAAFEAFLECWLINQENYLQQLLQMIESNSSSRDEEQEVRCRELIGQVMAHYGQYFEAKARVVQENAFLALSPTWLSSVERTYLWIGGFKPGLAFRLVINNVMDLTEDQTRRINTLMAEIKDDEKGLSDDFTRLQVTMTSPAIVELAIRHVGQLQNGAEHNMESAVDRLRASMAALVMCADLLRMETGIKLVEILKPSQAVIFLTAAAQLQLRLRRWGLQRDREQNQN